MKRHVTARQVARWKGQQKRDKRMRRLRKNHLDGCDVFASKPCSCGGRPREDEASGNGRPGHV